MKHWEGLTKSGLPQNNQSYDTLVEKHLDMLLFTKLQFFFYIAGMLPYLILFQSDSLMVPFIFDELSTIFYCFLCWFSERRS